MKQFTILLMGLLFLTTTACDDEVTVDMQAPVVDAILSLADINCGPCAGTDLNLKINVTDNDEIHDVHVSLRQSFMDMAQDISNSSEVFHMHSHLDANGYSADTTYTIDTAHHSTFYLVVYAEDHNGNSAADTASVHVHM